MTRHGVSALGNEPVWTTASAPPTEYTWLRSKRVFRLYQTLGRLLCVGSLVAASIKNMAKSVASGSAASCRIISAT